jgi:hypothetical protein
MKWFFKSFKLSSPFLGGAVEQFATKLTQVGIPSENIKFSDFVLDDANINTIVRYLHHSEVKE